MNLVFGAEGLSVGEGAFLMACCNHTDNHGYVTASMRQIRDEAHLKESAAKTNKRKLIDRGLLAVGERYHPKNGARIADLYRVNIDLLREMQRKNVDYGPTVIEELTFEAPQTRSSTPRSDSDGGGSDSDGARGSESDPLLPPSSLPSSLSGDSGVTPHVDEAEEREKPATKKTDPRLPEQRAAGPQEGTSSPAPSGSGQKETAKDVAVVVEAYKDALAPTRPHPRTIARLQTAAAELLALQWPVEHLARLAAELPTKGYSDLARHAEYNPPPAASKPRTPQKRPDACPSHPTWAADDCPPCIKAAARRAPSGPQPDWREMLAAHRAAAGS